MDPALLSLPLCVMMTCLIGAARCFNGDKTTCQCPEIPPHPLTEPPPETCFQVDNTFRYRCIGGYVRQVGTSNLIRCKKTDVDPDWTTPSLQCIPDPTRTTTTPPHTTSAKGHTEIPPDSIFTTTVTASTSPQTTQSINSSASVTAESGSAEPTSPGLQGLSDPSQAGTADVTETRPGTEQTTSTSTTAEPSHNGTASPYMDTLKFDNATTAGITCATLVIICAVIGISSLLYRRRSKRSSLPPHTTDEHVPMNVVSSAPAS